MTQLPGWLPVRHPPTERATVRSKSWPLGFTYVGLDTSSLPLIQYRDRPATRRGVGMTCSSWVASLSQFGIDHIPEIGRLAELEHVGRYAAGYFGHVVEGLTDPGTPVLTAYSVL